MANLYLPKRSLYKNSFDQWVDMTLFLLLRLAPWSATLSTLATINLVPTEDFAEEVADNHGTKTMYRIQIPLAVQLYINPANLPHSPHPDMLENPNEKTAAIRLFLYKTMHHQMSQLVKQYRESNTMLTMDKSYDETGGNFDFSSGSLRPDFKLDINHFLYHLETKEKPTIPAKLNQTTRQARDLIYKIRNRRY